MRHFHSQRTNVPTLLVAGLVLIATSCKKEFDTPPERTIPTGNILTVAQLRDTLAANGGAAVHFSTDMSVYCTITADEQDGNFYKSIYAQDGTAAICLRLVTSGGLYIGDRVRIYLPGTVLSAYQGLVQLDSINVDNNVVKQETLVNVDPLPVTLDQIQDADVNQLNGWEGRLVRVDSVEFIASEAASLTWSDAIGQTTVNRNLEDCNGSPNIIVRTSGYANYAAQPLPTGKGSMVAILSRFGSTVQLYVRRYGEVHMDGTRCPGQGLPIILKDFEDLSITSGGWTQQAVSGSVPWTASSFGSDNFAKINNYVGGANNACETWLISPSVDLSGVATPVLTFRTASNFTGPDLQVYVSNDYDGVSAPSSATWTQLTAALSPGSYTWTPSGALDLIPYIGSNVHVGFRYTGSSSDGKAYELDDIKISEN
ncbi:MAG: choice-of-anchor J domain-containing protein [Flavobacteriales bacterium]|nr:choice-of-anchor J domain-containing protein [Flavobacteriales bacterium]MCB9166711.1 choice-of-anchor J domain-containing protein [Flavobacteriales bacterium]